MIGTEGTNLLDACLMLDDPRLLLWVSTLSFFQSIYSTFANTCFVLPARTSYLLCLDTASTLYLKLRQRQPYDEQEHQEGEHRSYLNTSSSCRSTMPATRSSKRGSLLGHFQATKKPSGYTSPASIKGKGKAAVPPQVTVQESSTSVRTDGSSRTSDATASASSSEVIPSNRPQDDSLSLLPSSSRAMTPSPPPELLEATRKSPLSVRTDPDKGKFYLMYSSPHKKARQSSSSASPPSGSSSSSSATGSKLQLPHFSREPFQRPTSPTFDRTPIRETFDLPLQPPEAPRKRHLDEVQMDRIRRSNEESPLPPEKARPSFRALGASQETGLTLMGLRSEGEDESRAKSSSSKFGPNRRRRDSDGEQGLGLASSSDDDDLVITPRKMREQGTGVSPVPWATPTKSARFNDPYSTPRAKPIISAGIFSSLVKPEGSKDGSRKLQPRSTTNSDEDNPFLDTPSTSSLSLASNTLPIQDLPYSNSPALPLPPHYNALLILHTAIEHALVVHLATSGAASSSMDSTTVDANGQSIVRLPNLITYTQLKPLVERTSGRRLGPVELSRLMYLWSNGRASATMDTTSNTAPTAAAGKDQETLSGLGFLLTRQRILDAHGRRKWDWSLGIELTIRRKKREITPPLHVSFGTGLDDVSVSIPTTPPRRSAATFGTITPPSTPPSTSSPGGAFQKRKRETSSNGTSPAGLANRGSEVSLDKDNMSFMAFWNNGMEERKNEVSRRLRVLAAHSMGQWLVEQQGQKPEAAAAPTRPSTPPPRTVEMNEGGLITPSSTRPEGKRDRFVRFDLPGNQEDKDATTSEQSDMMNEDHRFATASTWTQPPNGGIMTAWHPEWNLKDAAPVPCAILPSLKDAMADSNPFASGSGSRSISRPVKQPSPTLATDAAPQASSSTPSSTGPVNRAQSLMDRIKAKESTKRSSLQAMSGLNRSSRGSNSNEDAMASFKRRSTLSRLNDVATNLHMLFVSTSIDSQSSSFLRRSPILPLSTVLTSVAKSSKVVLSLHEARACIDLIGELCPGWLEVARIGNGEFVKMGGGQQEGSEGFLGMVRRRVREELEK